MREGQSVASFQMTVKQRKKILTHIFKTSLIKLFSDLRVLCFFGFLLLLLLLMFSPTKSFTSYLCWILDELTWSNVCELWEKPEDPKRPKADTRRPCILHKEKSLAPPGDSNLRWGSIANCTTITALNLKPLLEYLYIKFICWCKSRQAAIIFIFRAE